MREVNKGQLHRARALSAEAMAEWLRVFTQHAPVRRPLTVLDLGSGAGRFTPSLADTFGGPVVGVEPSALMREVAEEHAAHPAVTYLDGAAESIPLAADSADLVLLFGVWQHVRDHEAAAAEIARMLRPGGRLLMRSGFTERMPELLWYDFFPGGRLVDEKVLPRLDHTTDVFAAAGLSPVTLAEVSVRVAGSLAEYAERLRLRGSSTFERLTETEIDDGFAALDAAVAVETRPRPIVEDGDLLVLERPA